MNQVIRSIIMTCLALLAYPADALEIKNVRADRQAFDPRQGEQVEIHFEISQSAAVELQLYDGRDLLVREIESEFPAGAHALVWDGRDGEGRIVPAEAYRYVLRAATKDDQSQIFDLSDLTGGQRLTAQNVTWDAEEGRIQYRLPEAARVAIRIGLKDNGPLLRTLIDWVPRPRGRNTQTWDGWDESGVLRLADHPKLSIFVDAYALSDNTLLVGPPPDQVAFTPLAHGQRQKRPSEPSAEKRMHYHPQQPLEGRGDVDVALELAGDHPVTEDGVPIVSGAVPIRFDVAPHDRGRAVNRRFETVFFLDGTFAYENEVGYVPVTWQWDADSVNPGPHYVTVNFRGYEGNFGVATLKLHVDAEAKP